MNAILALTTLVTLLLVALAHAWWKLGKWETEYRKLCLVGMAITQHHGRAADGMTIELVAPAAVPECPAVFEARIYAHDRVVMQVKLKPGERQRKPERPLELDEDMAAALA